MTRVRVKGFRIFNDRHGKPRCYHRATRIPVDLQKAPLGSAHFFAECTRIAALTTGTSAPKPGTLGLLILQYRAHAAFTDLAQRTRQDYQRVFDYLKPIDGTALIKIQSRAYRSYPRQGGSAARSPVRQLREGRAFNRLRLGHRARLRQGKSL
jgi:hypothetical protein